MPAFITADDRQAGTAAGLPAVVQQPPVPGRQQPHKGQTGSSCRQLQRVIVIGPAHHAAFAGLAIPAVDAYETPLGRIPLDMAAVARLLNSPLVNTFPAAHAREHDIEMQLPFLQRVLKPGRKLVPVLVDQLDGDDYRRVAALLQSLADATTLVVVSSDFTHYGQCFGFQPFPPDARAQERIKRLDMDVYDRIVARDAEGLIRQRETSGLTVCGYRAIAVLLEMLPPGVATYLADYTTSGALQGNHRESVSYLSILIATDY